MPFGYKSIEKLHNLMGRSLTQSSLKESILFAKSFHFNSRSLMLRLKLTRKFMGRNNLIGTPSNYPGIDNVFYCINESFQLKPRLSQIQLAIESNENF